MKCKLGLTINIFKQKILVTFAQFGIIILFVCAYSCKESNKIMVAKEQGNDQVGLNYSEENEYMMAQRNLLDQMPVLFWKRDSIAEANHKHQYNEDGSDRNPFIEKYEAFILDTSILYERDEYIPAEVSIKKGHLFDREFVHLIVGIGSRRDIYCRNVFASNSYHELIEEDKYNSVLTSDIENHEQSDTIFDVNGDGYKDYVMVLYSQSGCCLREVYRVYLYLPHCGGFTPYYEFMNPTFYPKEKIIRGVFYGHPGEVGLYEHKWDGILIKAIQEIYPNFRDSVNYTYLQYVNRDSIDQKPRKILNKLPQQFEKINGLEWFKGYKPKDFAERISEMIKIGEYEK
ncbi:MAG: hypothetical protein IPN29_20400 [Saprospiraceae bacterium]|nr:hypothetical protein [Saprospiraceae bacterium]